MGVIEGGMVEGGEAEGVEEPAETAGVTVFGEELAKLGVNEWAGLAEELLAQFEQLGGDLFGRNTERDVGIGGIGCGGGPELMVHADPFRDRWIS